MREMREDSMVYVKGGEVGFIMLVASSYFLSLRLVLRLQKPLAAITVRY